MDDSIKKLPPHERVRALKALQEQKKKELEELEKKNQEEMKEAQVAISQSLIEEEEEEKRKAKDLEDQLLALQKEQASLEEMVAGEKRQEQMALEDGVQSQYTSGNQSNQGDSSYTPINQIVEDLNRLQYTESWSQRDTDLYHQRKEELENTSQYKGALSEEIADQLDVGQQILHHMGYKR